MGDALEIINVILSFGNDDDVDSDTKKIEPNKLVEMIRDQLESVTGRFWIMSMRISFYPSKFSTTATPPTTPTSTTTQKPHNSASTFAMFSTVNLVTVTLAFWLGH